MGELSGSLLQVLTPEEQYGKRRGFPLMMEFPVNAALAPFLVTSSKSLLWVKSYNSRVKAALRKSTDLPGFFWEVIEAVIVAGREAEWGNVHPLSAIGLRAAMAHVQEYGLTELELLANPDTDWGAIEPDWAVKKGDIPMALLGLPIQPAPWVQPNTILVVPRDRSLVGFVLLFAGRIISLTHNSSRGIGVATSWEPGTE